MHYGRHRGRGRLAIGRPAPRGPALGRGDRPAVVGSTSPGNGSTASTRRRVTTARGRSPRSPAGSCFRRRRARRRHPRRARRARHRGRAGPAPGADRGRTAREPGQRRQGRRPGPGVGRHDGLRQAARNAALYRVDGDTATCVVDGLTISNGPAFDERGAGSTWPTPTSTSSTSSISTATRATSHGRRRFVDFTATGSGRTG